MIEIRNISKQYKNTVLFKSANIVFNKQRIKIKGENGTGKSVLLKMIVGYSVPDSGEIMYDGHEVVGKTTDFLKNAGVSINAPEFMNSWTGLENLTYLMNIHSKTTKEVIMEYVRLLNLENDINRKYKNYSLGMKQKLRIIQSLIDEPKYLILDEPFDALDEHSKENAKKIINDYLNKDPNRMLIYTSHNEADDVFADQIVCIKEHKLYQN